LTPFSEEAKRRTDQGDFWWELRACEYYKIYEKDKLVFAHFQSEPLFFLDKDKYYTNNRGYIMDGIGFYELGLLNSTCIWFFMTGETSFVRGDFFEATTQNTTNIPIPTANNLEKRSIEALAMKCQTLSQHCWHRMSEVTHRIPDLCPSGRAAKLTNRLREWWKLDFKSFRAEIIKAFKADIPLKQRGEWETFLREEGEKVRRLTAEIEQAEREIDAIVYKLFGLTPDEIALLESSLAGQY
jgi:TaqI-like C-terminal specificity domain